MKLILLGSGTSIPLPYMASPSLLLIIKGSHILFDIGPGTLRQLASIGISHDKIEQIFLSNFHPDHTADLVHLLPIDHTPHSLAYRIEDPSGKSFVYSGDTGFCNEIVDLAQGSDLLILECSFPDQEEKEGHLTPSLAGRIASLANTKRLLLNHFYPEVLTTDIARECRRTYAGELIIGRDLMHMEL